MGFKTDFNAQFNDTWNLKVYFFLVLIFSNFSTARTISDSLVVNLSCENLNVKSIYQNIKDDAFSSMNHIQRANWGTGIIANCWSLSHSQRIHFYLNRPTDGLTIVKEANQEVSTFKNFELIQTSAEEISNLLRGSIPDLIHQPMTSPKEVENKLKRMTLYTLDSNQLEDLHAESKMSNGSILYRSFQKEIESYQVRRFNMPSNLGKFVLSGPNTPQQNDRLMKQLKINLDQKKLTLLNLRATKKIQHVVVAKNYIQTENGDFHIKVYDSNDPQEQHSLGHSPEIIYLAKEKLFISPDVMGGFFQRIGKKQDSVIDAYIVDEEDRNLIERALLNYYKIACKLESSNSY